MSVLPAGVSRSLGIAAAFLPLGFAGEGFPTQGLRDAHGLFKPPRHPKMVPIYTYLSMKQQWVSPYSSKLHNTNPRLSLKGKGETLVTLELGMQLEIKRFGNSAVTIAGFY